MNNNKLNKLISFSALVFCLLIENISFSQSACPDVNAGPNVSICSGCTTLSATVQGSVATTSYSVSSIAYTPFSYSTGTPILVNIDDKWSPAVSLPFCFQFFGNTYNQVVIGANGLISFNTAYAGTFCQWILTSAGAIPTASVPINSIMGPYQDIDPTYQGNIYWQVTGTAPCRTLVVSYYQIPYYGDPNSVATGYCSSAMYATSQIVLYETTNIIDIYIQNKQTCGGWNGGLAIEGIQNATGTVAVAVPGRNNTVWTTTNDAYRFTPTGAPQYALTWYAPPNTAIGTTPSISVCPGTTTTYTATVVNTTCSGPITVSSPVTVNVNNTLTVTATSTPTSCTASIGTATGNPSGGNLSYTYSWNPGGQNTQTATGLASGNYSVTITDASGCSKTQTVTVTGSSGPTITASLAGNVSCNGGSNGSANSSSTGGTTPFTYLWSNGQTNQNATALPAGNYSVTMTDASGCTSVSSVAISQPTVLSSSPSQTNILCNGLCTGSAVISPTGGTTNYTYSWQPSGGNASVANNLCVGNYTATVTDANGCTTTQAYAITEPTVLSSSPSQTNILCGGLCNGSAAISPSGGTVNYTYNWQPSGGNSSAASNLCAGNYTATVTDANGCKVTTAFNITAPAALSSTPSQVNELCNGGNNGSVGVTVSGGTPIYTYLWSNAQTNFSATGLTAGNYSVTITDANGCTSISPFSITQPTVITSTTSSVNETCNMANGSATVNPSGGTGSFSYQWNNGQTTSTATGLSAGNYSVTITDANGCTYAASVTVNMTGGPTANAGPSSSVCFGNSSQLTANGGGNYSWSPSGSLSSATISNPVATPTSTTTYTLTVTDVNGCASVDTATITIYPLPVPNAGSDASVCFGFSTTLNGSGGGNYLWTPSSALSNATISNPVASPTSSATYSLTVTSANGCTNSDAMTITVNPKPTPNFSSTIVCFNNPTFFADQSTGGDTLWGWNFGDGNTSVQQSPSHTYGSAGNFIVTLTTTNSFGCKDSIKKTIIINPLPLASFVSTTVCIGNQTHFTDHSGIVSGNITGWGWNFGDPASGASNISNTQNPSHQFSAAGTYNVILTVTSDSGCQSTTNLTAFVQAPPVAIFTAPNVCLNAITAFTDGSTGGGTQWFWQFGDGGTASVQNPTHTYLGYGTYVVTLIVTSGGACKDTAVDTVTVNSLPIVNFSSDTVCIGKPTAFSDLSFIPSGNIIAWHWQFGDGDTSSLQNPSHVYSSAGTYNVTLTVTSGRGCTSSVQLTALVHASPKAGFSFTPGPIVSITDNVAFNDLSIGGVVNWAWNFGDSVTSAVQNPLHVYSDTGTYIITQIVVSQYGCIDSIKHILKTEDYTFYIPNAVTLNGDGLNEFFFGKGIGITEYEMWIFDRWGNNIFYCRVPGLPQSLPCQWDGTVKGGNNIVVQEDVYVWKVHLLNVFGKEYQYIGTVTVVK